MPTKTNVQTVLAQEINHLSELSNTDLQALQDTIKRAFLHVEIERVLRETSHP